MKKTIYIITPVSNEEESIDSFLNHCEQILTHESYTFIHLLITDRSSKDRTESIIREIEKGSKIFKHIFYEKSQGVVSCYLYGAQIALENNADYIIEMDSGFSHPPEKVKEIIGKLESGYDCVFMSRLLVNGGFLEVPGWRTKISFLANLLTNTLFSTTFTDAVGGFKGFKRKALKKVVSFENYVQGSGWQIQAKLLCRNDNWIELPYIYKRSKSTFKFKWILYALKGLFIMRRSIKTKKL